MAVTKYKLGDLAKDFGMKAKDFTALLGEDKKSQTPLTEEELNLVFETFTRKHEVKNFNEYFSDTSKKSKETEEKPVEKKAEKPAPQKQEKPAAEKKAETPKKETLKPAEKKADAPKPAPEKKPVETQKPFEKKPFNNERKPQGDRPFNNDGKPQGERPFNKDFGDKKPFNRDFNKGDRPFNKDREDRPFNRDQKPQGNRPAPQKTEAPKKPVNVNMPTAIPNSQKQKNTSGNVPTKGVKETKTIDTRTVDVNLERYNEKYENMADNKMSGKSVQTKQKINQKSAKGKMQSNKRESEADKLRRLQEQREKTRPTKITIGDEILVGELASRMKLTAAEIIKKLMLMGVMASVSQSIDFDTASLVALEFGVTAEKEVVVTIEERLIDDTEDKEENLLKRDPVVVVMGHVDHGKTSLLDAIRNTSVTAGEAGGITQHIGAYRVAINGENITFLDTPGHAAFTSMRARGAQVTDIAILVVAADDGIMPQTVEAINHAKAAGVPIIVAINKMDKPEADPNRVMQGLTEYELVPEEWGGDVICVPVSAKAHTGIDQLLEMVILVAETNELKANPNRLAKGTVIEAKLDKGRGPVATVLVQNGTLNLGDVIVAGSSVGRVRVMTNDRGERIKTAGPSVPVEITGLDEVPSAGDIFNAVADERLARELVEQRKHEAKEEQFKAYQKVTLDNLFSQIADGEVKELPVIVKADVQGSVEAVKQSLEKISNDEVRVRVIHGAVGAVAESDVMLANASNAIIVGFNVRPDPVAKLSAERDGVDIRLYRIIYDAIEEITDAMKGMLAPKFREVEHARIEVRSVFKISGVGAVAGCYVVSGKVSRNDKVRVVREGIIIADDEMASLKRFKDDVKEVAEGFECGITLNKFNDVKEGDIYETYIMEEYREA